MSRSSKKGPWVEERLMGRIEALNAANNKKMLRTWSRASTIFPDGNPTCSRGTHEYFVLDFNVSGADSQTSPSNCPRFVGAAE